MEPIQKYFDAERAESLLFILVGLMAIGVSVYFLAKLREPFYTGMTYPFVAIALIQITVGVSVYVRSPKDIERVRVMVQQEQVRIQSEEIPRMNTVMKNFRLYKWIEISLLLIGVVMFFYFGSGTSMKGLGLGLSIQAGFMLFLDLFAEARAKLYAEYLGTIGLG